MTLPRILPFFLLLLTASGSAAQDVRYITDTLFVPVRSGPGNDYRIVHRGITSGTRVSVKRDSEDGLYSEITTDRGTAGWVRSQYLISELPARNQLESAMAQAAAATARSDTLAAELDTLAAEKVELLNQLNSTDGSLDEVSRELAQLKKISANAVQLDSDNRRLVEQLEVLKAELDTLRADNQRLQDNIDSEAFMNGALAVLLGVMITLLVPRLWPKRRRSSSWA
jgi:SH3 domain protein